MFVWLMVALKVPLAALLLIVWWATRPPEGAQPEQRDWQPRPQPDHPRPKRPRPPRRGPHAGVPPAPPKRIRARARRLPTRH
jgi:hypothetical protein